MTAAQKVLEIIKRLKVLYPNPTTELNFSNNLECLIAVMLSAQTTDKQVNKVTPQLFQKFKTAQDYASSSIEEINSYIKSVNYHNTKAKNIYLMSQQLIKNYNSQVPETMQELMSLQGVGRKTANVVMSVAFGKPEGIAVDTHVSRLSRQLLLTNNKDPLKIEQDLLKIVPKNHWHDFHHLLILYGRYHAPAHKHLKDDPLLKDLCQ